MAWQLIYNIVVANLFHGLVCLIWISGVKRLSKPLAPDLHAELLRLALIIPACLALLRALQLPVFPVEFALVRVGEWSSAIASSGLVVKGALIVLFGGLLVVFSLQELIPLLSMLKRERFSQLVSDERLDAAMLQVGNLFREANIPDSKSRTLQTAARIPLDIPLAGLHGLTSPILIVSEPLLKRLDDLELKGVVAHEAAHLYFGGNLRLFVAWIARALQAFNPFSLVLFRELIETRELACDSLAARVTEMPEVLARALEKFDDPLVEPDRVRRDFQQELRHRAEQEATRIRLHALREEGRTHGLTSSTAVWLHGILLGGILWGIG